MLRSFFIALGFLTIIPSPPVKNWQPDDFRKSSLAYPAVGLLISLILIAIANVFQFPKPFLQASVLIALWFILTGGLHFDGFCDIADAVFASKSPAERQVIAKDPRIGSFALLSAILLIVLKIVALASITNINLIIFVAPVARTVILPIMAIFPLQSGSKMAKMVKPRLGQAALSALLSLALLLFLSWEMSVLYLLGSAIIITSLTALLLALWINKRMAGLNGDSYGAIIEFSEMCLLLVLSLY